MLIIQFEKQNEKYKSTCQTANKKITSEVPKGNYQRVEEGFVESQLHLKTFQAGGAASAKRRKREGACCAGSVRRRACLPGLPAEPGLGWGGAARSMEGLGTAGN